MISAENRWREWGSGGGFMPPVSPAYEDAAMPGYRDNALLSLSVTITRGTYCKPFRSGLNEDVEHNAILIDSAPEVMLHALDPDEDFVQVPLIPWPRPVTAQAVGETRTEFLAPTSHRHRP